MPDTHHEMKSHDIPVQFDKDRAGVFTACCVASIVMVFVSIAESGSAILKILETTPFMGILVDENGNQLPPQGYPQLGFGVAGILFFSVLFFVFWLCRDRALTNRRSA